MRRAPEELTVLVIEDDEDDFVITRGLLAAQERTRFQVEWAASYEDARQAITEGAHDVYLVDYRLGAHTGLELVREAFDEEERPPVIVLTGQGDYEVDLEATLLGVTDYLLKDQLNAATLERSIRYAVSNHQALRELRQTQERYALAVRGANDGIWDWDLGAQHIYFAPRWKAMLGEPEHEVSDSPSEWLERVHPDDSEGLQAAIRRHLEGRSPHFESEHRMRHSDGTYRWVFSRGVAIRGQSGKATRMAGSMSDITDRKVAEQRLVHDALHDALTGLPNRALFLDRLTLSLRRAERHPEYRCAVLFLDLDRFKVVNDGFSHAVGDQLLVGIAGRLIGALRPGDTVARLGGDEFTILLDDVGPIAEAEGVAARIQATLDEPFEIEGRDLVATASMGISISKPGSSPAELMRNADIAMYDAKGQGKARTAVFNARMHNRAVGQLRLETELRRAVEEESLRVFYQPIVELSSGRVSAFEALARWPNDSRTILPEEFIPVAEDIGLIGALGRLVLNTACTQLSEWRRRGVVDEEVTMSVNVSRVQLGEADLLADVTEALERAALPADALRLEITETTVMDDTKRMPIALDALEAMGVHPQIDDFGSGYASLTFLRNFPGDALKIDRSFIASLQEAAGSDEIVRATIELAHRLNLRVIAEGVERPAQLKVLRELGCEYGQGFLFAKPHEAEVLESLLAHWDPLAMAAPSL